MTSSIAIPLVRLLALALAAAALAGCQTPTVDSTLVQKLGGAEPETQLEFWHALMDQPVTGNDDAFHAIILFFDNKDDSADYAARAANLKQRGWLAAGFDGAALDGVDRGTVASILVKALEMRGGLTRQVVGAMPRYAVRTLQYHNIYPPSGPSQGFSGRQLLAVLGRVEDYQRYHTQTRPPAPSASPVKEQFAK